MKSATAGIAILLIGAAAGQNAKGVKVAKEPAMNALSKQETAAGWKLLSDGKSTAGWRGFRRDVFPPEGWEVQDGTLHHAPGNGAQSKEGGDIITAHEYSEFELTLEWKLAPGGNSGIKYLVDESMVKEGHSGLGFEMQVLDDATHADSKEGRGGNRTAGALYDLIAPRVHAAKPAAEWNQVRLVVNGNHVEHWLNGQKVVEFERFSPALQTLIADSKYKNLKGFGDTKTGHILLQDHGSEVWYRNIKLRPLVRSRPARTENRSADRARLPRRSTDESGRR